MNDRNHNRAPGMVAMSIPMPRSLKTHIEEIAKMDDLRPAEWVRRTLFKVVNRSMAARRKGNTERSVGA